MTAETEQAVSAVCSECVRQERSFIIRNSSEFPIIQKVLTGGMRTLRRGKGCLRQPPRRREKAGKPLMIRGELRRACPLFLQEMGCPQKKNRDAKISLWCIGAPGRGILLLNLEEQKEA